MSDHAFSALRAALSLPWSDEPYHVVLKRAEQEAEATRDAAVTWLLASVAEGGALACSELLFWVGQAHKARIRLEAVRARKSTRLRCTCERVRGLRPELRESPMFIHDVGCPLAPKR